MSYLKGGLFGLVGAVLAAALWLLLAFVLPIVWPMLMARLHGEAGASGASIGSDSIAIAALIGFAIGMVWGLRR